MLGTSDKVGLYNLLKGLTTYLYRGYNPITKYHGHPRILTWWHIRKDHDTVL